MPSAKLATSKVDFQFEAEIVGKDTVVYFLVTPASYFGENWAAANLNGKHPKWGRSYIMSASAGRKLKLHLGVDLGLKIDPPIKATSAAKPVVSATIKGQS